MYGLSCLLESEPVLFSGSSLYLPSSSTNGYLVSKSLPIILNPLVIAVSSFLA